MAIPGINVEFGENVPEEMKPFWNSEVARTIHSLDWWKELWDKEKGWAVPLAGPCSLPAWMQ